MAHATPKTRLRERREALGFTLAELSKRTGFSTSQLNDVERGRIGAGAHLVRALAVALRLKPHTIQRYLREAQSHAAA